MIAKSDEIQEYYNEQKAMRQANGLAVHDTPASPSAEIYALSKKKIPGLKIQEDDSLFESNEPAFRKENNL